MTVIVNAGVQVLLGRVYAGSSRREPHHSAGHNILFQRRLQSSLGRLQSTLGGLLRWLRRSPAARRTNQFQNRYAYASVKYEYRVADTCTLYEFITKCDLD